jgi:hypothetical protein
MHRNRSKKKTVTGYCHIDEQRKSAAEAWKKDGS